MPLNQALVGKAYPAISYEVGREKLREFAIAVGETDPIYDEAAARAASHPTSGRADLRRSAVAPGRPGRLRRSRPGAGLLRGRPRRQEFVHRRPIRAGDRLLASGKVAAAQAKGRHELLTLETEGDHRGRRAGLHDPGDPAVAGHRAAAARERPMSLAAST